MALCVIAYSVTVLAVPLVLLVAAGLGSGIFFNCLGTNRFSFAFVAIVFDSEPVIFSFDRCVAEVYREIYGSIVVLV